MIDKIMRFKYSQSMSVFLFLVFHSTLVLASGFEETIEFYSSTNVEKLQFCDLNNDGREEVIFFTSSQGLLELKQDIYKKKFEDNEPARVLSILLDELLVKYYNLLGVCRT